MRLAWMKRSVLPMMILFVLGCAQLPTGADEATVTLPADRMASQESNGDSIQYLGDITTTVIQAMATGPFWHADRWWHDGGLPYPMPWTPPEIWGSTGGSGVGGTPPGDLAPWDPLAASDTLCRAWNNETVEHGKLAGRSGPMNSQAMMDSLRALFADARAANTEMGGYFYQEYYNSPIQFIRLAPDLTLTDACKFYPLATGQAPGAIVGYVHTHQAVVGVNTPCIKGGGSVSPDNIAGGGGSPEDWDGATTTKISTYTVDATDIWRLDPGVLTQNRLGNRNRWAYFATGCPVRFTY